MNPTTLKRLRQAGLLTLTAVCLTSHCPAPAQADTEDSTEEIISLLKQKDIITGEEADRILARHKQTEPSQTEPSQTEPPDGAGRKPVTVVVPGGQQYLQTVRDSVAHDIKEEVTRQVKQELKEEIAQEVKLEAYTGSVPAWTKRIRFGGDIRIRYQGNLFSENNADLIVPGSTQLLNRTVDTHQLRYRVRVSAKAQVNNQTEVGIRLATGNEDNPISTNDTLGDYLNKDTLTFDLAYLKITPIPETSTWAGKLDFWGGRLPNPFLATDLVWDNDVNFEGLATTMEVPFNTRLSGFLNAGAFPLDDIDFSSKDKWLLGGQLGMNYTPRPKITYTLAMAYYDYENIKGERNPNSHVQGEGINDFTAPRFRQLGNTLFDINAFNPAPEFIALAADYKELNVTGKVDIGLFDPIYISFLADFVKNIGYNSTEVNALTGLSIPQEDIGYMVSTTVGYPQIQKLLDWQVALFYKYLEADAVLDAFTDSDFHLGGTNAKGWGLSGQLGILDNVWLRASWMSSEEISGPPISVDTFQIDINSRF